MIAWTRLRRSPGESNRQASHRHGEERLLASLDSALDRDRERLRIAEERIRSLDAQSVTLAPASIALLALVAAAREEAFTRPRLGTILLVLATLGVLILVTCGRITWERRQEPGEDLSSRAKRREGEYLGCGGDPRPARRALDLGEIGREINEVDWLIDERVSAAAGNLKMQPDDAAKLRLLVRCAWKKREASVTTRYSKKKRWAIAAAGAFFIETVVAVAVLGTTS